MTTSNLSRTKTKFRTTGNITGNFGIPKTKVGDNKGLGLTNVDVVHVTTQDDYLDKMFRAYQSTQDMNLKKFCYDEIRKIMIQRGTWHG